MAYLEARTRAFAQELEYRFYGSNMSVLDRHFRVVASSKAAEKKGGQANYLLIKPTTFDLPRTDLVLRDGTTAPGYEGSGIALKTTVRQDETEFEVYQIQDDDVEPFVRLVCNRKQGNSVT